MNKRLMQKWEKAGDRSALLFIVLLLSGCTGLKHATEERPMFTGFEVEFTEEPVMDADEIRSTLEGVVQPKPNNSFLGMRPTVALHNMVKEPEKKKGFKFFLKYRLGSQPVYLEDVPIEDIVTAMENRMNNRGYFKADARSGTERDGRTATIRFTIRPDRPHVLHDVTYEGVSTDDTLARLIADHRDRSLLMTGDNYDLELITEERVRISDALRNKGYYRFREEDLIFAADTNAGDHQVDLRLHVKPSTHPLALLRYSIGDVYVHGDRDEILPPADTVMHDSLHYINYLNVFRPDPIIDGVFIRPGDHFSMRRTDWTQRYLSSYGVFSNTQVIYKDDSMRSDLLHADVLLTPQDRFTFSSELNAVTKSNNFAGPGVRIGFKDRGLLRGGEILNVDLSGRFETQIGGPGAGTNAYELSVKSSLQIPRLVFLDRKRRPKPNAPTTRVDLGYTLFRRINLYGLSSANGSFNYLWRQNYHVWHDVQVPEISFNKLIFTSPEFDAFLGENRLIQRAFDEQFIFGVGYTYTRSSRTPRHGNKAWYVLTLSADEGGNVLNALSLITGPRPEEGYRLFDQKWSQFVRFRPEFRYYMPLNEDGDRLVYRLLTWAAYPYGNSDVVPFVKQFYAGGPMSIRAFRARSVGPGSYVSDQASNLLVDQVGDLRLEANVEYRYTLAGIVKGAFFVDAGNVWLLQEDPQRPGGKFELNDALQEIAFGAGAGIRIDPEILVIRLDLAFPLRRPDMPRGQRWIFDATERPFDRSPVLNIAIGYPF